MEIKYSCAKNETAAFRNGKNVKSVNLIKNKSMNKIHKTETYENKNRKVEKNQWTQSIPLKDQQNW